MMNTEQLKNTIVDVLDENKGTDIRALDVRELTDVTDYFVICTATSSRHAKSLSDKVIDQCKAQGNRPVGVEGDGDAEWILIDLVDVVVHIMLGSTREFYSLEKLWEVTEAQRKSSSA